MSQAIVPAPRGGARAGSRAERTAARLAELPKVSGPLEAAGELISFGLRAFREIPVAVRLYPSEVVRQAGLLIRSNAIVIFFMLFMLGGLLGITGTFLFESLGLESYVAAIPAVPAMRGVIEIVFAWVFAAKAGCGIVAELGAMRISEEVDAIEVMGVRPVPYLVSTKILATIVTLPLLFATSMTIYFLASRLFFSGLLKAVSPGGFNYVLFLAQGPRDFFISVFWASLLGVVVAVVACYFGYNAKGGPVGVGRATAQSMLVNLVLISLISMMLAQVFYAGVLNQAFGT